MGRCARWKAVFERFGFIHVDPVSKKIELTPLGRQTKSVYDSLDRKIEGANDHLARLGISYLSRFPLKNPIDGENYPPDSDVRPFLVIWRAMRQLDNRLHWEELNRVLMKVMYERDVDAAIEKIRAVRKKVSGVYDEKNLVLLGKRSVEDGDETKRRITPWFTRAGFGGLFIDAHGDESGFRSLVDRFVPLIDEALDSAEPVPQEALRSKEDFLAFLTNEDRLKSDEAAADDEADVDEVLKGVERYGSSKIICLTGIPGTGKTRLARMVANRLVDGDPYRFMEIQFREGTSYEHFVEGFVPRPSGDGFELRPKTLRIINRRASLDPDGLTYVLLIEEFHGRLRHALLEIMSQQHSLRRAFSES